MRKAKTELPLGYALVAMAALLLIIGFLGIRAAASNVLDGASTLLNADGKVYEINPDAQGMLWISDLDAGELRSLNPAGDTFTIYPLDMQVSDARRGADGVVWWANYGDGFGSLDPGINEVSLWRVPGANQLSATAIDEAGQLWLNDVEGQELYSFNSQSGELCTYSLPEGMGPGDYLLSAAGQVWSADRNQPRLLRLVPDQDGLGSLTTWELPEDSYPEGLALDNQGRLWWADEGLSALGRLDPSTGNTRIYSIQSGMLPEMVALALGQVWFTEHSLDLSLGRVGLLDPDQASFSEISAQETAFDTITPSCGEIEPESSVPITPGVQAADWRTENYLPAQVDIGLTAYRLPEGSLPWGIAASAEQMWIAIQGTQTLLRLEQGSTEIYLPTIIK